MEEYLENGSCYEMKKLITEIQKCFLLETDESKWSLLKTYQSEFLVKRVLDKTVMASYVPVLSTLLDALRPNLFREKWQETVFDEIFLGGISHESFLILVKRLSTSEKYAQEKIITLLLKFLQGPTLENLLVYQCESHSNWDLKYVSKSNIWDDLITVIISLPERVANVSKGSFKNIFSPSSYVTLLLSSVFKALNAIYEKLKNSQDCSLEFLSKLTGRLCFTGNADVVADKFIKELLNVRDSEYIWRRILQNFILKMPTNSLDSFVTNLLLKIPWYGYVEWILGDEGVKNEKINYIMTVKLLFFRPFKQVLILQNTLGYFASSSRRSSHFIKILNSLCDSWVDKRALKHQSIEQKMYVASALMICAGWLKQLKMQLDNKDFISKVLKGTQNRLESSEETVRNLGMIVGKHLIESLDPGSPTLEFEFPNMDLGNHLKSLLEIPLKPDVFSMSAEDFKCLEFENKKEKEESEKCEVNIVDEELNSDDDDLKPYDMSNDNTESQLNNPLYLRDCMLGLLEQGSIERCLKHAEELIKSNPYAAKEVAKEMTKIVLNLTDDSSLSDFVTLRQRVLITLTVQCPLIVSDYLIMQFTEKDYTIRQRLDILEVLAASSAVLARSNQNLTVLENHSLPANDATKSENNWQIIINRRLEAKTKRYTKHQTFTLTENHFSGIAGNFFYSLLNSYDKVCNILKFHGYDSYILGRFIYTLGIIMCSAANTLHCSHMGTTFLQFLSIVRSHEDVFVRQSAIFAVAAIYTSVPSSLLFDEMLPYVTDANEWLQNVAKNDSDGSCIEKALYTLSIFQNAAAEGAPLLYQLRNLTLY